MQAKIIREKIITFKFDSKVVDQGKYEQVFRIRRRSPRLDTAFITTKSILCGGSAPVTRGEMLLLDTIATLTVYVEPLDKNGKVIEGEWMDDILDQEILFAIHKEWADFQNSFYPEVKPEGTGDQGGQETKPAATPQAPVQG